MMFTGVSPILKTGAISSGIESSKQTRGQYLQDLLALWPEKKDLLLKFDIKEGSPPTRNTRYNLFYLFVAFVKEQTGDRLSPHSFLLSLDFAQGLLLPDQFSSLEKQMLMRLLIQYDYGAALREGDHSTDFFCNQVMNILGWNHSKETQDSWDKTTLDDLQDIFLSEENYERKCRALNFLRAFLRNTPFPRSQNLIDGDSPKRQRILICFLQILAQSLPSKYEEIYAGFSEVFQINEGWWEQAALVAKHSLDIAKSKKNPKINFLKTYGRVVELGQLVTYALPSERSRWVISKIAIELLLHLHGNASPSAFDRMFSSRLAIVALATENVLESNEEAFKRCLLWCQPPFSHALIIAEILVKNSNLQMALFAVEFLMQNALQNSSTTIGEFKAVLRCLEQCHPQDCSCPSSQYEDLRKRIISFIQRGFHFSSVEFDLHPRSKTTDEIEIVEHYTNEMNQLVEKLAVQYGLHDLIPPVVMRDNWLLAVKRLWSNQLYREHELSQKSNEDLHVLYVYYSRQWLDSVHAVDLSRKVEMMVLLTREPYPKNREPTKRLVKELFRRPFHIDDAFLIAKWKQKNGATWKSPIECSELYVESVNHWVKEVFVTYQLEDLQSTAFYLAWMDALTKKIANLGSFSEEPHIKGTCKNDLVLCLGLICGQYFFLQEQSRQCFSDVAKFLDRIHNVRYTDNPKEVMIVRKEDQFFIVREGTHFPLYPPVQSEEPSNLSQGT